MSEADTEGLAPGWDAFWDEGQGAYYYHNEDTGETTWDKPTADADDAEAANAAESEADVSATADDSVVSDAAADTSGGEWVISA